MLDLSELVVVILFTIEYGLRIVTAPKRARYIFSFYGLIDLIAVLPFYLSLGADLRAIRVLRVFRVFRVFKLVRYNSAMAHYGQAISHTKEELVVFLVASMVLLFLSGVGIYYFEFDAQPEQLTLLAQGVSNR